jgi:hypothetical protein
VVSIVSELELSCISRLSREKLIEGVRARAADLPADLLGHLEDRPTDQLQLLLLAGRLILVLRHLRNRGRGEAGPSGPRGRFPGGGPASGSRT